MYHGDVNPSNILMTSDFDLKLADFDYSGTELGEKAYRGTVGYLSPEL
jgi:thiamine kinase-like enzyme